MVKRDGKKRKLGYWFGGDVLPHGDGRHIRKGATLKVEPPLELCECGLHYSTHPFDALEYSSRNQLWLVEDVGETLTGDNKCCTTARKHVAKIDAEPILRAFARRCALSVIDQWDAPEIVVRYLKTGDESVRRAAKATALVAANTTTRSSAWSAAWFATDDLSWEAARASAYAASAATVSAAVGNTSGAAREAAWHATTGAQRRKFKRMIDAEFRRIGAL